MSILPDADHARVRALGSLVRGIDRFHRLADALEATELWTTEGLADRLVDEARNIFQSIYCDASYLHRTRGAATFDLTHPEQVLCQHCGGMSSCACPHCLGEGIGRHAWPLK